MISNNKFILFYLHLQSAIYSTIRRIVKRIFFVTVKLNQMLRANILQSLYIFSYNNIESQISKCKHSQLE